MTKEQELSVYRLAAKNAYEKIEGVNEARQELIDHKKLKELKSSNLGEMFVVLLGIVIAFGLASIVAGPAISGVIAAIAAVPSVIAQRLVSQNRVKKFMSRINKQANPKFSEVEKWWQNYGDAIHKMNTLGKRYGQDLTKEYPYAEIFNDYTGEVYLTSDQKLDVAKMKEKLMASKTSKEGQEDVAKVEKDNSANEIAQEATQTQTLANEKNRLQPQAPAAPFVDLGIYEEEQKHSRR